MGRQTSGWAIAEMNRKDWAFVAVCLAVAAILLGWVAVRLWGAGPGMIGHAKSLAAADLIDPSSAQFRNVRTSKYLDNVVCGEINGKNRLGAYTGFTEFVVSSGSVSFPPPPGADEFQRLAWEAALGFCN